MLPAVGCRRPATHRRTRDSCSLVALREIAPAPSACSASHPLLASAPRPPLAFRSPDQMTQAMGKAGDFGPADVPVEALVPWNARDQLAKFVLEVETKE